jgi:hypothetical protein
MLGIEIFNRWVARLRQPLAFGYALLALLLAAMGTYFTHQAIIPHQEDYLGKWYAHYDYVNSDGSRTELAGNTQYFANGHYNYSGTLRISVGAPNFALFDLSGAGEWQGDDVRLTVRLTTLTAKMVTPEFFKPSDIVDLEQSVTHQLQGRSGDYQVRKLDHHQMVLTTQGPTGDILTFTQQKR